MKKRNMFGSFVAAAVAVTSVSGVISVLRASAAPTAIINGATATASAERVSPPVTTVPSAPASGHFSTLPPGSALPSDATCAAAVRPMAERRADNGTANHTVGTGATDATNGAYFSRVTGNYTGTTDELIEWTACKWGIDEDIVRAQIAKESWWHQSAGGDTSTDQSTCYPAVRTTSGPCPQSVGLGQVRYPYHLEAFTNGGNAYKSSAYNLDYTYAVWRNCYEDPNGVYDWLNTVDRGSQYAPGDLWGCVGTWFAGRWHTADANTYITAVQTYLSQRIWETPAFRTG